jgi:superfamily II DNA/RNA helicase
VSTFETLAIAPALLSKLAPMGITEPTEIQSAAIPPLLEGKDAILQAQTGTGKTLAYLLPVLSRLDPERKELQAIIVAPTHELSMQIVQVIRDLTEGSSLFAQQLIGGANVRHQIERLKKKPPIVVGTPGRLAELITAGKLKAQHAKMVVIDEVDQLLDPTFRNEVIRILKAIPRARQTIFASATIPAEVQDVARRWMNEPLHLRAEGPFKLPAGISHGYIVVEERDKLDALRRLLHAETPKAALAFVNDASRMEELVSKLTFKGMHVAALQGGSHKLERAAVLKAFKDGKVQVLLATEVAARGLDVPGLTHVFNLELPTDGDHYLHRAGRTGRGGQPGTVISIVTERERFVIDKFAQALGIPFEKLETSHGKVHRPGEHKGGPKGRQ